MADDFIIDGEPVNRGSTGANSVSLEQGRYP